MANKSPLKSITDSVPNIARTIMRLYGVEKDAEIAFIYEFTIEELREAAMKAGRIPKHQDWKKYSDFNTEDIERFFVRTKVLQQLHPDKWEEFKKKHFLEQL